MLPTSCEMLLARAARHLLAVHGRVQVDLHVVALGGGPLDGLQRREPLAQALDLLVDLALVDLELVDRHLDRWPGPAGSISGRTSTSAVNFSGSPSLNSVISTSGRPSVFSVVLADRGEDVLRDRLLHRLVEHRAPADPLVDHGGRDLAPAEAGNL